MSDPVEDFTLVLDPEVDEALASVYLYPVVIDSKDSPIR